MKNNLKENRNKFKSKVSEIKIKMIITKNPYKIVIIIISKRNYNLKLNK